MFIYTDIESPHLRRKDKTMAEFELTYNLNGGLGDEIVAANIEEGGAVTLPGGDGITKDGFTFGGWSETIGGEAVGAGFVMPGAATTLYAVWTAEVIATVTVTYNVNGGVGDAPDVTSGEVGADVTLKGVGGMTKEGFGFGGWATTAGGTVPLTSPYKLAEDITVYAIWTAVPEPVVPMTYEEFVKECDRIIGVCIDLRSAVDYEKGSEAYIVQRVTATEKIQGVRGNKAVKLTYLGFNY